MIALPGDSAGVEQHDFWSNGREVVFNLEVVDGMVVTQDFFQQRPQLGNVPLPIAQVVEKRSSVSSGETWKVS